MSEVSRLEIETMEAIAQATVLDSLMLEIVAALRARNLITRGDVAGAFFRTEHALKVRAADMEAPPLIKSSEYLELTMERWTERMSFHPHLHALRHRVSQWETTGMKGNHPAQEGEIVRDYNECGEETT